MSSTGVSLNIWAACNLRPWSGLVVGELNGNDIQIPTFDDADGAAGGLFRSAEESVSGYGSPSWTASNANRRDMSSEMAESWGGGGVPTAAIDTTTGRLKWSVTAGTLSITACSNPAAFGLRVADFPTPPAASYVAPDAFSRGVLAGETITFQAEAGVPVTVPRYDEYEARVLHLLRRCSDDATDRDDAAGTKSLAYAFNVALNDALCRARLHIDDEEHFVATWPSSQHAEAPIFTDAAFRKRFGIAGTDDDGNTADTFTVANGVARFRSARPVHGGYLSPLGLKRPLHPSPGGRGRAQMMFQRGATGGPSNMFSEYPLVFFVDSVVSPFHASRPAVDIEEHLAEYLNPFIPPGWYVTPVFNHDWREYLNPTERGGQAQGASLIYSTDRNTSSRRMQRAPGDFQIRMRFDRGSSRGLYDEATIRLVKAKD